MYFWDNSFADSKGFQKPVPLMIPAKDHFTYENIYNTYSISQEPTSSKFLRVWDKKSPLNEHLKYWYIWKEL